jgi:hypothetical protein
LEIKYKEKEAVLSKSNRLKIEIAYPNLILNFVNISKGLIKISMCDQISNIM